ncbi:MAG: hypothetical protein AAFR78_07265, partial [Planctomycetota bacterium]
YWLRMAEHRTSENITSTYARYWGAESNVLKLQEESVQSKAAEMDFDSRSGLHSEEPGGSAPIFCSQIKTRRQRPTSAGKANLNDLDPFIGFFSANVREI